MKQPDPVTATSIRATRAGLVHARKGLVARPAREIADVLGRVGERFATDNDPMRRAALAGLPDEAGLSDGLSRAVLDGMAADWTADRMGRLLSKELGDPECLDRPVLSRDRTLMAFGPALCVQISSGSVPGVGVNALIRSLLVKAPTLIKPGAGDVLLTRLFAEALHEEDADLGDALAVLYWPGGASDLTRAATDGADVVVAYGSDEAVGSVRAAAPATARFVGYHHRFGVGLVGRSALNPTAGDGATGMDASGSTEVVAAEVARAVSMFEHRGCVCPHVIFVEEGGAISPEIFAELVAEHLDDLVTEWPSPKGADAGALQQARGTLEIHEAAGAARLYHGGPDNWTVVFASDLTATPRLPGRAVTIRPVGDLYEVPLRLEGVGLHLQSVGYAGVGDRTRDLAAALGRIGASRVVPFARMSFPPPWWLHDGRGPLSALVRWVEVESEGERP